MKELSTASQLLMLPRNAKIKETQSLVGFLTLIILLTLPKFQGSLFL